MALILGIVVVGYNKAKTSEQSEGMSQEYKDAMSKGKSNVIEEEYDKAIDYFKLALESKKDDTEAKNLIKQLNLLVEAEDSEEHGAYFFQIEKIDKINEIKTETDVVTTGTPAGVGPVNPGDIVDVEIQGIGTLRSHIV